MTERLKLNEQIRAKEVRVIDDQTGQQLGIMSPRDALVIAREKNLDLVEVAPNATPPVCRIIDYGKFQYERAKKEREARKGQKNIEIKEMRIRPDTDRYHIGFKVKRVRSFLKEGAKVKIRMLFKGREITHAMRARDIMETIAGDLADAATVEQIPALDGKSLVMVLAPGAHKGGAVAARAAVRGARNLRPPPPQGEQSQSQAQPQAQAQPQPQPATTPNS